MMKKVCLTGFLMVIFVMMGSCDNDLPPVVSTDPRELVGTWFHSFPHRIDGPAEDLVEESGEIHMIITFKENGEFIFNRTTLGIYTGFSPRDTSSIRIESGNYIAGDGNIDVVLDRLVWRDFFYRYGIR
ncbi:hypothetical protein [Ulvibacterium sp.]|uniref:hypothetical protein n=1 Tax=Ulvibacterium sp. TaxID=2665914 RepID=UPI003BABA602